MVRPTAKVYPRLLAGQRRSSSVCRLLPSSSARSFGIRGDAASRRPTRAIIDDLSGRRCAEAHGVPLRGTLGTVLLAKMRGKIPSARAVLAELRAAGMYLSDRVVGAALAEIGE
jgi:hypothetical protein